MDCTRHYCSGSWRSWFCVKMTWSGSVQWRESGRCVMDVARRSSTCIGRAQSAVTQSASTATMQYVSVLTQSMARGVNPVNRSYNAAASGDSFTTFHILNQHRLFQLMVCWVSGFSDIWSYSNIWWQFHLVLTALHTLTKLVLVELGLCWHGWTLMGLLACYWLLTEAYSLVIPGVCPRSVYHPRMVIPTSSNLTKYCWRNQSSP